MRRITIFLLILGIGSFVLPLMGRQFVLVSIFEGHEVIAGSSLIAGGVLLLVLDRVLAD
ncbi:MAG TPA: hypothetical protein VFE46_16635 [Pirellulales bacterium]|jgi:hypothetical protein|nr:hypothetical protein [Pirellulales bacterium]